MKRNEKVQKLAELYSLYAKGLEEGLHLEKDRDYQQRLELAAQTYRTYSTGLAHAARTKNARDLKVYITGVMQKLEGKTGAYARIYGDLSKIDRTSGETLERIIAREKRAAISRELRKGK